MIARLAFLLAALAAPALLGGCAPVLVDTIHPVGCERLGPVHGRGLPRRSRGAVRGSPSRQLRSMALSGLESAARERGANYVELTYETVPYTPGQPRDTSLIGHSSIYADVTLGGIAYRCPVAAPPEPAEGPEVAAVPRFPVPGSEPAGALEPSEDAGGDDGAPPAPVAATYAPKLSSTWPM